MTAPNLSLDIAPWDAYESPTTGKMITSKAARKIDLAESSCRPYEGLEQERKEAKRQSEYKAEAEDKELTKTIEQSFRELPESLKAATIA